MFGAAGIVVEVLELKYAQRQRRGQEVVMGPIRLFVLNIYVSMVTYFKYI